jgi:hypothetical protein
MDFGSQGKRQKYPREDLPKWVNEFISSFLIKGQNEDGRRDQNHQENKNNT